MAGLQRELIVGGQKSGKTARAEQAAAQWLAAAPGRQALYLATALPWDAEMQARIARHQHDRAVRVPGMRTVQADDRNTPLDLVQALQQYSRPDTLIVLDCLTLWLTQQLMPLHGQATKAEAATMALLQACAGSRGPLQIVSNEIGLGVIPLGGETRAFVDALGRLNQGMAAVCSHVTLMVAGLPLPLKTA